MRVITSPLHHTVAARRLGSGRGLTELLRRITTRGSDLTYAARCHLLALCALNRLINKAKTLPEAGAVTSHLNAGASIKQQWKQATAKAGKTIIEP